jgi:hypothetical protein
VRDIVELKPDREFQETLQQYERLVDETLNFNPANCSWGVVLEELRKAQEAAAESERRGKGLFTKNRRKLGRISMIITPVLQALPDHLSILHGGLAVIFNVRIASSENPNVDAKVSQIAQHREKNRQDILDAFEDIPEIIAMAHSKSKNFPDDKGLRDSIENLKMTLLEAIPNLVDLLRPGTFR